MTQLAKTLQPAAGIRSREIKLQLLVPCHLGTHAEPITIHEIAERALH